MRSHSPARPCSPAPHAWRLARWARVGLLCAVGGLWACGGGDDGSGPGALVDLGGGAGEDLGGLDLGRPDAGPARPDLGPPPIDLGPGDQGAPDLGPADLGPGDPDEGVAPPDLGPPPGERCAPCERDEDCESHLLCGQAGDGSRFCTSTCLPPRTTCPAGYLCQDQAQGPDLCVPEFGCDNPCFDVECEPGTFCDPRTGGCRRAEDTFCQPCQTNGECGGPDDLCLGNPFTGETFCTLACDRDADCPPASTCLPLQDGSSQCFPERSTCDDPCAEARCPEGTVCVVSAGGLCMSLDQMLCSGPCMNHAECGREQDLCVSFPDQPGFCARFCSMGRCEADADCGDQGLTCTNGFCQGCEADEQCPPDTVCRGGRCGQDCPEGFFCAEVTDPFGNVLSAQCAPNDGECQNDHLGQPCGGELGDQVCGGLNPECTEPLDGGICTRRCRWDSDCPSGWRRCLPAGRNVRLCQAEPLEGPDACAHPGGAVNELGVGRPCLAQGDCEEGQRCHVTGDFDDLRRFCTQDCFTDEDCGTDARCVEAPPWGRLCLPDACACLGGTPDNLPDVLRTALQWMFSPCSLGLPDEELAWAPATWRDVPLKYSWQERVLRYAPEASRQAQAWVAGLDLALDSPAPLGSALRALASAQQIAAPAPLPAPELSEEPLVDGLAALFRAGGEEPDLGALRAACVDLPPVVGEQLGPLLQAIAQATELRDAALLSLEELPDPEAYRRVFFQLSAGFLLPLGEDLALPVDVDTVLDFYDHGYGGAEIFEAGLRVADALDAFDAAALRGLQGVSLNVVTPLGRVILADAAAQQHDPSREAYRGPIALLVDTGGDDTYRIAAGANAGPEQAVAVCVDLAGDDQYLYPERPDPNDEGLLPSDAAGRLPVGEFPGQVLPWGAASFSEQGRQGSGRMGVGALVDLGGGADVYRSLRFSQGAAAAGVGLLFDDGGDDLYEAEAASQGAATFGWGLLLDGGGADHYRTWTQGQGFGGPRGVGALVDWAGDDEYLAEPGAAGEPLLYPSVEGISNTQASHSQGAALGYRHPEEGSRFNLAGGLGILRDRAGTDRYRAGSLAQGMGLWWGMGVLADRGGADEYGLRSLGQAWGGNFGLGLLFDGGGDDAYGLLPDEEPLRRAQSLLGSASDWGLGFFVDEWGADRYRAPWASLGAAVGNGLAIFIERAGADHYVVDDPFSLGHALALGDANSARLWSRTLGVFVDAQGQDRYERADLGEPEAPAIGNDSRWEQSSDPDLFWEQGRGADGAGSTPWSYQVFDPAPRPEPAEGEGEGEGEAPAGP